jgi:hypothetical protein
VPGDPYDHLIAAELRVDQEKPKAAKPGGSSGVEPENGSSS